MSSNQERAPSRWASGLGIGLALLSLAWMGRLVEREERLLLIVAVFAASTAYQWGVQFVRTGTDLWKGPQRGWTGIRLAAQVLALPLYVLFLLWIWRPDWLPQRITYDFIANRHVTERLVDPALLKTDRWDILGQERDVLFVHPTAAGSTALVYPLKIEVHTTLRAELAVAPEAWTAEGDGVTFSVYVEDAAGMHLVYARYVDPKHHELDRRWIPMWIDLTPFAGRGVVRLILVTGSGPAGDLRYDWAGWGEPRLEKPGWP
ncbi:MAG: hypothetical protein JW850_06590 [Thermoflexales bacterium]|nr:hypothetical protein [Thermoflexales bacterium]